MIKLISYLLISDLGRQYRFCHESTPQLVVVKDFSEACIIADTVKVHLENNILQKGCFDYMVDLMASYYVWDLSYPRCFMELNFLQDHMIQDHHDFYKTTKYKLFEKLYVR